MSGQLKETNEAWNKAWLEKDESAVERIAAEDYQYIGPQGQIMDRDAILGIVREPTYRLIQGTWTETSISILGSDTAIIIDRFRGNGEYRGQTFDEDHRRTAVWIRREGRWQVRLEHVTAIRSR